MIYEYNLIINNILNHQIIYIFLFMHKLKHYYQLINNIFQFNDYITNMLIIYI